MSDLPDDLTMRTVIYRGDIDDPGVVIEDSGAPNVKVKFSATGEEWVSRTDLEDVTETFDLAHAWGLTDADASDD
jgi:hypothetical protein